MKIWCPSGWWFGIFFIFPYIGNNHPNWLIFFRGVQTTNQPLFSIVFHWFHGCPEMVKKPFLVHLRNRGLGWVKKAKNAPVEGRLIIPIRRDGEPAPIRSRIWKDVSLRKYVQTDWIVDVKSYFRQRRKDFHFQDSVLLDIPITPYTSSRLCRGSSTGEPLILWINVLTKSRPSSHST